VYYKMINRLALLEGNGWDGWGETQSIKPVVSSGEVVNKCEENIDVFDELGVSDIDQIQEDVIYIKTNYRRILQIAVNYVEETNHEKKQEAMREVDTLVQQTVHKGKEVRLKLDTLKLKNARFESEQPSNSTKAMWRNNQLRTLTWSVKEETGNVETAADNFFNAVAKRSVVNYCSVSEINETGIESRAECDPYRMQAEIEQKLKSFGVSDLTVDEIQTLEKENREIRAIAEAVKQLNTMFEQMATIFNEQGAKLDEIAANVAQTPDHVSAAKQEIINAESIQKGIRMKKLGIVLFCIAIVVIIVAILSI